MKKLKNAGIVAILPILIWAIFAYLFPFYFAKFGQMMDYGVLLRAIGNDMVYSIEFREGSEYYEVKLKGVGEAESDTEYRVHTIDASSTNYAIKRAKEEGVEVIENKKAIGFLHSFLGKVFVLSAIAFTIYLVFSKKMNGNKDKANRKQAEATVTGKGESGYTENVRHSNVRFSDVAGLKEEIIELEEIVDFLKFPEKYTKLGAKVPKGVLLHGKPGTGKTLLAKAVAGEAQVNFIEACGSEFVNRYVGVGADNIRKLFNNAQDKAPCIIFIDEIDAIGGRRDEDENSERKQAIDELLAQLDGFEEISDIIVLAATNNLEQLDPALTRPGRFDRTIYIGLPDVRGREDILKVHSRNKPLLDEVNLHEIAKKTAGFSGADLENLMNEAAIHAARKSQEVITNNDLAEAFRKITVGIAKSSHVLSEKEKNITAVHEAGHAVVSMFMQTQPRVSEVSIIPHGRAGGYTMHETDEDKNYKCKEEFIEKLAVLMAGRAAEQIFIGDISTGASNDIDVATKIARDMVAVYGMSESLGPISIKSADTGDLQLLSDNKLNEAGDEVVELIKFAEQRATEIINKNPKMHNELVQMLLEKESISGDELMKLYSKHVLTANAE